MPRDPDSEFGWLDWLLVAGLIAIVGLSIGGAIVAVCQKVLS